MTMCTVPKNSGEVLIVATVSIPVKLYSVVWQWNANLFCFLCSKAHATVPASLQAVMNSRHGGPFAEPVIEEEVPGYHAVISQPMDLGTIRQGIQEQRYTSLGQP